MSLAAVKTLVICVLLAATVAGSLRASADEEAHDRIAFEAFKARFERRYDSPKAELNRFEIFRANLAKARRMQAASETATFDPKTNEYFDMSPEEFSQRFRGGFKGDRTVREPAPSSGVPPMRGAPPKQWDWRMHGAVSPSIAQGLCGACYAFTAVWNIEGMWVAAGHNLTALSPQQIVSCDTIDGHCDGGTMTDTYNWLLQDNHGEVDTLASYPYVSKNNKVPKCDENGKKVGAKIISYKGVVRNENDFVTQLYDGGPFGTAVDSTHWQLYSGGIFDQCESEAPDHTVLIVGYDDAHNPPYWILKNSWGEQWGEDGFIRIKKGSNQCLITSAPSTAIVTDHPPPPPSPVPPPTPKPPPPTPHPTPKPRPTPCPPGPTPPPTPRPPPPTPAPTTLPPTLISFTQYQCSNNTRTQCSADCKRVLFPIHNCLCVQGGGSTEVRKCANGKVIASVFPLSHNCSAGFKVPIFMDAEGKCMSSDTNTYFTNHCNFIEERDVAADSQAREDASEDAAPVSSKEFWQLMKSRVQQPDIYDEGHCLLIQPSERHHGLEL